MTAFFMEPLKSARVQLLRQSTSLLHQSSDGTALHDLSRDVLRVLTVIEEDPNGSENAPCLETSSKSTQDGDL